MSETATAPPKDTESYLLEGEEDETEVRLFVLWWSCFNRLTFRPWSVWKTQEIRLMKQRVAEMEREAEKLRELQAAAESASTPEGTDGATPLEEDKTSIDGRSVFVGNVCPTFRNFYDATAWLRRLMAYTLFSRFLRAGRLQRHSGRAARPFPGVRDNQQDHHPL